MMWFSLFFMPSVDAPRVKLKPTPQAAITKPARNRAVATAASVVIEAPARRIASIPSATLPAQTVQASANRLSLADLRRLTFEKHQDLFERLVDPIFKPWAWLSGLQPQRKIQMQNFLNSLNERGRVWSSKQEIIAGTKNFEFETEFRILEGVTSKLRARVDLRVRFEGQELSQTTFEDEARISTADGRPYAMFDLSGCPTDLNEHIAIVMLAWPDGQVGSGDFRVLSANEERWMRSNRSSWVELAPGQSDAPSPQAALERARPETCTFTQSWH